jgi:hypothetical protein
MLDRSKVMIQANKDTLVLQVRGLSMGLEAPYCKKILTVQKLLTTADKWNETNGEQP